jgi:hypothetical protein
MENLKTLSQAQLDMLRVPLPKEAISPHPTKKFLSSIKNIYVTERFNEVFGVGRWSITSEVIESSDKMVVIKTNFTVPEYGIYYECYGGNDNPDRGDAYKGAVSDAITKIGSWLGVGAEVFKGLADKSQPTEQPTSQPTKRREITAVDLDNEVRRNELLEWSYKDMLKLKEKDSNLHYDAAKRLSIKADISDRIAIRYNIYFIEYIKSLKDGNEQANTTAEA